MTTKDKVKGGSFIIEQIDASDVFTPEDFNDEQKMIAKTTVDFVEGEVAPHREQLEKLDIDLTVKLLKKAGELGLLGADVPEEYDGLGLDKISSSLITENFTRGGSFALSHGAHVGIGSLPIVYFGSKEQKAKYLPKLATGEWLAAYALTEPGSGSDALGAKTTAKLSEDGKHWILNGTKQFITNAGFADVFVVYAKIDGEKFSAFIVERNFPGVSVGPEEKKMGIKASSTRPLILEDAQVPVENLLGEEGRGHVIAFNILNIGRYKLGNGCVGSSKHAIELSAQYANERKQFGRPISSFPLIGAKLAEMNIKTYVLESLIYRIGGLYEQTFADFADPDDRGRTAAKLIEEYAIEASIAKVFGSEVFDYVVDEGVQIHGGYGFIQEYPIEQMYRDSRINRIFEGTNEINRLLIPGTLLRKAMKGDIPLMQAAMKLQSELMGMAPAISDGSPLGDEQLLLDQARKAFLMVGGLAVQKYQQNIDKEQEILANLADIMIEIYAMESAILRTKKALAKDVDKAQLKVAMTKAYVNDAFARLEAIGRETLAAMEEGDMLRTQLSIFKKLTRFNPANTVALKREIAAKVIEAAKYVC
ncbi:acyl-CoA dehydrogenase family protein [Effusibacillus lacus]|uniref:Acyl-CoA dehydrogenase n=1 Tax=Effusibacillus lacus TaxID=1348429 RepID=A0A292YKC8_9BACL|nr:acyl-CoA dehydrogenase family protein [Effusibacillus lacus]TCS68579.1 alkylation response protein AidB-like acyl-CoA dehydrogenase [Effusibacillus lacus]GAX88834.1 acyl-CoA dehydrogenase [Effusibacillus lacus]